jgi:hypothetical protein
MGNPVVTRLGLNQFGIVIDTAKQTIHYFTNNQN